jgi:hypothetical protein
MIASTIIALSLTCRGMMRRTSRGLLEGRGKRALTESTELVEGHGELLAQASMSSTASVISVRTRFPHRLTRLTRLTAAQAITSASSAARLALACASGSSPFSMRPSSARCAT